MTAKKWIVSRPDALDEAVRKKLKKTNQSLAKVIRELVAEWAGVAKKDATMTIGRPKNAE